MKSPYFGSFLFLSVFSADNTQVLGVRYSGIVAPEDLQPASCLAL